MEFPLPSGYFAPAAYTAKQLNTWKTIIMNILDIAVVEEGPMRHLNYTSVNKKLWTLATTDGELHCYKPRSESPLSWLKKEGNTNFRLAMGKLPGTIEDAVLGFRNTSTEDARVCSNLYPSIIDVNVLNVLEDGIAGDPMRAMTIKWHIFRTPCGKLVKNRDACYVDYTGIAVDDDGERYGFYVMNSIDIPECPTFHPSVAIRAHPTVVFIFRQLSATEIGVYSRIQISMQGQIPSFLGSSITTNIANIVRSALRCTEAKKLTSMALECSPVLKNNLGLSQSTKSKKDKRLSAAYKSCSLCYKITHSFASRRLRNCQICGTLVCSRCQNNKKILADTCAITVAACIQCIHNRKDVEISLTTPIQKISAIDWYKGEAKHGLSFMRRKLSNSQIVLTASQYSSSQVTTWEPSTYLDCRTDSITASAHEPEEDVIVFRDQLTRSQIVPPSKRDRSLVSPSYSSSSHIIRRQILESPSFSGSSRKIRQPTVMCKAQSARDLGCSQIKKNDFNKSFVYTQSSPFNSASSDSTIFSQLKMLSDRVDATLQITRETTRDNISVSRLTIEDL